MNIRALNAEEAAISVLGSVMLDNSSLDRIATLKPADFADRSHQLIFEQMQKLAAAREPVDVITLATAFSKAGMLESISGFNRAKKKTEHGVDYLSYLSEASASAIAVKHHASIVRDRARARELMEVASEMHRAASDGDYDSTQELIGKSAEAVLALGHADETRALVPMKQALKNALVEVKAANERGAAIAGLSTGFKSLDDATGGLEPGKLIIFAGRPAMGKTALALNIATNVAKGSKASEGQPAIPPATVAIFSIEMGATELGKRLIAAEGRIDGNSIKTGVLSEGDIERMLQCVKVNAELPIQIDEEHSVAIPHVRARCREIEGLGLVVIDYLQLMKGNAFSREQVVAGISRDLKILAKELHVPIILIAQLNRDCEKRPDKRPMLSDLRESGAIEQDADMIVFVYRDEYYNPDTEDRGFAEVIIGKHRSGSTGTTKLRFTPKWTRFDDINQGGY